MNEKETAILNAASSLFSAKGYHAVGVDSIVAKSNVAKMTFYKYFPSKEFLIESVLERRDRQLQEDILKAIAKRRTSLTKIKAIFDWYEEWFSTPQFHGCMFIKASEEFPKRGAKVRSISRAHKIWLEGLLSDLLREHGVSSPSAMASHIMILLDGLTVRSNMFDDTNKTQVKSTWTFVNKMISAVK